MVSLVPGDLGKEGIEEFVVARSLGLGLGFGIGRIEKPFPGQICVRQKFLGLSAQKLGCPQLMGCRRKGQLKSRHNLGSVARTRFEGNLGTKVTSTYSALLSWIPGRQKRFYAGSYWHF